jgi:hypothetical protein
MRNMVIEAKERVYLIPFSLEGATIYFVEKSQQQIRLIVDSTNVLTLGTLMMVNTQPVYIPRRKISLIY